MYPPGIDHGDLIHFDEWLVRGLHVEPVWHIGAPEDTTPGDRGVHYLYYSPRRPGRTDSIMDLKADKKVALTPAWSDEMGHRTVAPADAAVSYTVDDPTIVALLDNGDGTWHAASTGTLGTANVHGEASWAGRTATGDVQFVVIPGDAERFEIEVGPEEEVTPDDVVSPEPV